MKTALVLGAGGFIGGHMTTRLKNDGFWGRGVGPKPDEQLTLLAEELVIGDLRDPFGGRSGACLQKAYQWIA